jgi:hypothetical protein
MQRIYAGSFIFVAVAIIVGCGDESKPQASGPEPRAVGEFAPSGTSDDAARTPATQPALPPGHPPIAGHGAMGAGTRPSGGMPNDAIHGGSPTADALHFTAPEGWQPRPKRMMTEQVFALPKAEGDEEDADLAVSFLGTLVPLNMNVDRWCEQFGIGRGAPCEDAARKTMLDNTKYPTTVIEITGTYTASSMMAPAGEPKPGYKMLAAEIRTPTKPWYVKLIGPEKTVEKWRDDFTKYVRSAQ